VLIDILTLSDITDITHPSTVSFAGLPHIQKKSNCFDLSVVSLQGNNYFILKFEMKT
jgi:hypothetical protein